MVQRCEKVGSCQISSCKRLLAVIAVFLVNKYTTVGYVYVISEPCISGILW